MQIANIVDDKIIIEIEKSTLQYALDFYNDNTSYGEVSITDINELFKDFCAELNREEEDGTTLLHVAFDSALANAIENGSLGVEEIPNVCYECGVNVVGYKDEVCEGCEAYRDHTR